jgi:hypothetical protein
MKALPLALVLETIAVATDADDYRVAEDRIQHRRSEHANVSISTAEGQARREDD